MAHSIFNTTTLPYLGPQAREAPQSSRFVFQACVRFLPKLVSRLGMSGTVLVKRSHLRIRLMGGKPLLSMIDCITQHSTRLLAHPVQSSKSATRRLSGYLKCYGGILRATGLSHTHSLQLYRSFCGPGLQPNLITLFDLK